MEKLACRFFMVVLAAAVVQVAVAQTVHVVGDNMGWEVPGGGGAAYTSWASSRRFVVGDILTFNFQTNSHDVQRVPKESFDTCNSSNPIGDLILTGPVNVTLTTAGDHYYICTSGGHCLAGQKLSITVRASGSSSSPTRSPQPSPPRTSTPTTPEATSPDERPPPPAAQPTGSTGGPVTDPRSSSSAIVASSLISTLSVLWVWFSKLSRLFRGVFGIINVIVVVIIIFVKNKVLRQSNFVLVMMRLVGHY